MAVWVRREVGVAAEDEAVSEMSRRQLCYRGGGRIVVELETCLEPRHAHCTKIFKMFLFSTKNKFLSASPKRPNSDLRLSENALLGRGQPRRSREERWCGGGERVLMNSHSVDCHRCWQNHRLK